MLCRKCFRKSTVWSQKYKGSNFVFRTKAKERAQVHLLYEQFIMWELFPEVQKAPEGMAIDLSWSTTGFNQCCLGSQGELMALSHMWRPLLTNARIRCGG